MSDYSELNLKAQAAIDAIGTLYRARRERDFNDACTPQVVQALIAENERLNKDRTDWQAECIKRGFTYCREPDDHYVLADVPEMADLLGSLLGLEVRDRENDSYGDTVSSLTDQVDAGIDAFHRAYEAEKERDQLKAENEALCEKIANLNVSGFAEAFYTVAEKLGVTGARPVSPMQVFASEVLPALQAAIKDAERYRFIRNRAHEDGLHALIMYRNRQANTQCIVGNMQADAVIDNLMREAVGSGEKP